MKTGLLVLVGVLASHSLLHAQTPRPATSSCVACHAAARDLRLATPAALFTKSDVHRESGLSCVDCHGGSAAATDSARAHASSQGFRGIGAVTTVCGSCHAAFAQKFAASVHQPIFDKGCVECHGNHGVVAPSDRMLSAETGGACASCHTASDASDKGTAAAVAMRTGLERLKSGIDDSSALIRRIRNAGIEVSDQQLALREAATKLTLARTEMHGFDVARVEAILAEGTTIVSSVDRSGQQGVAELRFRRRGLAASLGAILIVVVALALKIRQIDRRAGERDDGQTLGPS